jgi:hypothetical protein
MSSPDATLAAAEEVSAVLAEHGVLSALIGGLALAAHGYTRATEDLDLGTSAALVPTLRDAATALRARGYDVELRRPDADDPLDGLLHVTRAGIDPIQVVNFRHRGGAEAVAAADPAAGLALRVVTLPHLVALKLYAGGPKSRADVLALLAARPDADLTAVRKACRDAGLEPDLDRLLVGS